MLAELLRGAPFRAWPTTVASVVVDASRVGALVGAYELAIIAWRSSIGWVELPSLAVVVVGFCVLGSLVIGAPWVLVVRSVMGCSPLRAWVEQLRTPGQERIAATTRGLLGALGIASVGVAGYLAAGWGHVHYREAQGAAFATAGAVLATAMCSTIGILVAHGPVVTWACRQRWLIAASESRRWCLGWLALALAGLIALHATIKLRAPAWDPAPAYVVGAASLALTWAAIARVGRPPPRRWRDAFVYPALALAAGLWVGRADQARLALREGVIVDAILARLQALADHDGDGFSGWFGGLDCADDDPTVNPRAREVPGNQRDDNCLGGDLAIAPPHVPSPAPVIDRSALPDVLLVSIDSLRADHCSRYGYARPTTPTLDALARSGATFERAIAAGTVTRVSLPALLFGRGVSALPLELTPGWPLVGPHQLGTLASGFGDAGYHTIAIVSNEGLLSPHALDGFQEVIPVSSLPAGQGPDNGDDVAARALTIRRSRPPGAPVFMWIHLLDPHYPYRAPVAAERFGTDQLAAYDAEIAFADAQLARVLEGFSARTTIIAVTADHGEAFGEHHEQFHGGTLYGEQLHVPLVIATPGGAARSVSEPISLVDVAPTLLELAGVAVPSSMTGVSWAATVRSGAPPPVSAVISELVPGLKWRRSAIASYIDHYKLIFDLDRGTTELFDLASDPHEQSPIDDPATGRGLFDVTMRALDRESSQRPR